MVLLNGPFQIKNIAINFWTAHAQSIAKAKKNLKPRG